MLRDPGQLKYIAATAARYWIKAVLTCMKIGRIVSLTKTSDRLRHEEEYQIY